MFLKGADSLQQIKEFGMIEHKSVHWSARTGGSVILGLLLMTQSALGQGPGEVAAASKISDPSAVYHGQFGTSVCQVEGLEMPKESSAILALGVPGGDTDAQNAGELRLIPIDNAGGVVSGAAKTVSFAGSGSSRLRAGDGFGSSVCSLGDLDGPSGPSTVALAVGAPYDDDGGLDRGAVWILFFNADWSLHHSAKISDNSTWLKGQLQNGDLFGSSLTVVQQGLDLTGQSVLLLAVGAPGDSRDQVGGGAVWMIALDRNGHIPDPVPPIADLTVRPSVFWKERKKRISIQPVVGGRFGQSVASLGDLNGDGTPDLAVGSPSEEDRAGAIRILCLDRQMAIRSIHRVNRSSYGLVDGPLMDGHFGSALASLGDIDGDGVHDLAVGAPGDDSGLPDADAIWLLFLNRDGTVRYHQKILLPFGVAGDLPAEYDRFGTSVAAVRDPMSDRLDYIAVGTPGDDMGAVAAGAVWLLSLAEPEPALDGISGSQDASDHPSDVAGDNTLSIKWVRDPGVKYFVVSNLGGQSPPDRVTRSYRFSLTSTPNPIELPATISFHHGYGTGFTVEATPPSLVSPDDPHTAEFDVYVTFPRDWELWMDPIVFRPVKVCATCGSQTVSRTIFPTFNWLVLRPKLRTHYASLATVWDWIEKLTLADLEVDYVGFDYEAQDSPYGKRFWSTFLRQSLFFQTAYYLALSYDDEWWIADAVHPSTTPSGAFSDAAFGLPTTQNEFYSKRFPFRYPLAIEGSATRGGFHEFLAWLWEWDSVVNPYFQCDGVQRRAMLSAFLSLIAGTTRGRSPGGMTTGGWGSINHAGTLIATNAKSLAAFGRSLKDGSLTDAWKRSLSTWCRKVYFLDNEPYYDAIGLSEYPNPLLPSEPDANGKYPLSAHAHWGLWPVRGYRLAYAATDDETLLRYYQELAAVQLVPDSRPELKTAHGGGRIFGLNPAGVHRYVCVDLEYGSYGMNWMGYLYGELLDLNGKGFKGLNRSHDRLVVDYLRRIGALYNYLVFEDPISGLTSFNHINWNAFQSAANAGWGNGIHLALCRWFPDYGPHARSTMDTQGIDLVECPGCDCEDLDLDQEAKDAITQTHESAQQKYTYPDVTYAEDIDVIDPGWHMGVAGYPPEGNLGFPAPLRFPMKGKDWCHVMEGELRAIAHLSYAKHYESPLVEDEFLFIRRPDYYFGLYSGPCSQSNRATSLCGLGTGGIAGLWVEGVGAMIMAQKNVEYSRIAGDPSVHWPWQAYDEFAEHTVGAQSPPPAGIAANTIVGMLQLSDGRKQMILTGLTGSRLERVSNAKDTWVSKLISDTHSDPMGFFSDYRGFRGNKDEDPLQGLVAIVPKWSRTLAFHDHEIEIAVTVTLPESLTGTVQSLYEAIPLVIYGGKSSGAKTRVFAPPGSELIDGASGLSSSVEIVRDNANGAGVGSIRIRFQVASGGELERTVWRIAPAIEKESNWDDIVAQGHEVPRPCTLFVDVTDLARAAWQNPEEGNRVLTFAYSVEIVPPNSRPRILLKESASENKGTLLAMPPSGKLSCVLAFGDVPLSWEVIGGFPANLEGLQLDPNGWLHGNPVHTDPLISGSKDFTIQVRGAAPSGDYGFGEQHPMPTCTLTLEGIPPKGAE